MNKIYCRDCKQEMEDLSGIAYLCKKCHLVAEIHFRKTGIVRAA